MGSREGREEEKRGGTFRKRETNKRGVSSGYGLVCEARLADRQWNTPRAWKSRLSHRKHEPTRREEDWAGMAASPAGCVHPAKAPCSLWDVQGTYCLALRFHRHGMGCKGSVGMGLSQSAPPGCGKAICLGNTTQGSAAGLQVPAAIWLIKADESRI